MCIDILLATYNGEKYIRQQLLSIIAQRYRNWRLIIHDDGSTDGTVEILKEFLRLDTRITMLEDSLSFKSPALNFLHLLNSSESKLICFCDQDDIWFENKLSVMVDNFPETEIPTALISEGYLYQSETNKIIGNLDYQITNLKELLFVNGGIHGSRAMINRQMRDEILKYHGPLNMHDHIMALIACSYGEIKYINIPLFLYRQHSENVSGNVEPSRIKRLMKGFTHLKDKYLVNSLIYNIIGAFRIQYDKMLSHDDKVLIQSYLDIPQYNKLRRGYTLIRHKFSLCKGGRLRLVVKACSRKFFNS